MFGLLGNIIGTIIFGGIIGILARLALPGKQTTSVITTVIIGIVGALIGYWIWGGLLGKGDTRGVDWIRWIISIAVAAALTLGWESIAPKVLKR